MSAAGSVPGSERVSPLRVMIAFVLCPALGLFLLRAPLLAVGLLAALVGAIALREVHLLCGMAEGPSEWTVTAASVAVGAAFYTADLLWVVLVTALVTAGFVSTVLLRRTVAWKEATHWVLVAVFGLVYVAMPLGLLVLLRRSEGGAATVTSIVLGTWSRDIGAFLTGRVLKGRPIRQDLNPQKHWIGALGGLLVAALTVAGVNRLADGPLTFRDTTVLGAVIGVFGQAGDLFESLLKRAARARHSGVFLPDQGGVLDSIDGLLLAGPVAASYLLLLRHLGQAAGF